jgi:hypothetical protein
MASVTIPDLEIIACLPGSANGLAGDIRARGNVPVAVGTRCIFELTPDDIYESWLSASKLRAQVAGAMVAEISHRLCEELRHDESGEDVMAGEAAALLFLALRHRDVPLHDALEGCRITWDDRRRRELVECFA